ncbi:MAG: AMP-binding protein [Betaproteobacteria bacterium]|nr:AMP-binding protein [Betaproteobacteria bacterium]
MAISEETVPALLRARAQESPNAVAFAYESDGGWQEIQWHEFLRQVETLAFALRSRGLKAGDHVGILAPTSLAWELVHHAVLSAGGVVVGLEPHDIAERLQTIAEHADLSILVAGDKDLLKKLSASFLARMKLVVLLEGPPDETDVVKVVPFRALLGKTGETASETATAAPNAAATLIYTSGTTGQPKGILYRHAQVTLAVRAITEAYPSLPVGARLVCWLPLSNLFQRIMNLAAVATGGTVFLVSNPLAVLKALPHARPDVFIGVPRFFEKLHAGIVQEIEKKGPLLGKALRAAIAIGDKFARTCREERPVSPALRVAHFSADKLVLRRLRQAMGGQVQFMVTGSAPTPRRLLEFFDAIGLPLYEAYGLSENIVPMALNRPGLSRHGTVGTPLPENSLMLDEDGELLVKGAGVFAGYHRDSRTDMFNAEGYYKTGDYASIESDRFLRLLGRKSEIIKTSTGRRIAPAGIEAKLELSPYVERAMALGSGRKCLTAVLTLSTPTSAKTTGTGNPVSGADHPAPSEAAAIDSVAVFARELAEHERPAGYIVLRRPLSIEAGELTPNLKIKRKAIEDKFAEQIDALYDLIERRREAEPVFIRAE